MSLTPYFLHEGNAQSSFVSHPSQLFRHRGSAYPLRTKMDSYQAMSLWTTKLFIWSWRHHDLEHSSNTDYQVFKGTLTLLTWPHSGQHKESGELHSGVHFHFEPITHLLQVHYLLTVCKVAAKFLLWKCLWFALH